MSAQIRFLLLQNRQGKTRLSKWYVPIEEEEKRRIESEVHRHVTQRDPKFTNFLEYVVLPGRRTCVAVCVFFAMESVRTCTLFWRGSDHHPHPTGTCHTHLTCTHRDFLVSATNTHTTPLPLLLFFSLKVLCEE